MKAEHDWIIINPDKDGYPIYKSEVEKFRQLNKIVGINAKMDILLVKAGASSDIRPAGYELSADILMRRHGKPAVVVLGSNNRETFQDTKSLESIVFYPASGVIVPRKKHPVNDIMVGWKHTYVVLDSHSIPQSALDELKKPKTEDWLPPVFDL